MKTAKTLQCKICMEERKTIRNRMKKGKAKLINDCSEIFGACTCKTSFHRLYRDSLKFGTDDAPAAEKSQQTSRKKKKKSKQKKQTLSPVAEESNDTILSHDSALSRESPTTPQSSATTASLTSPKMVSNPSKNPERPSYSDIARRANLERAQLDQIFILEAEPASKG